MSGAEERISCKCYHCADVKDASRLEYQSKSIYLSSMSKCGSYRRLLVVLLADALFLICLDTVKDQSHKDKDMTLRESLDGLGLGDTPDRDALGMGNEVVLRTIAGWIQWGKMA